jgi:chromosome partitioning protein
MFRPDVSVRREIRPLRVVAIVSQKGGAGKTTVAVHLAVAAQEAGLRSAVIDLDPQATARTWGDRRGVEPDVISDHAERLPVLIDAARAGGADILFVDTAAGADRSSLLAAKAADLIIVPCRPGRFDLDAIGAAIDVAQLARRPAVAVLNAAPIRSAIVQEAAAILAAAGIPVAPVILHSRVAWSHAVIDGRSAIEIEPDGKAAAEIRALFAWITGANLSARLNSPEYFSEYLSRFPSRPSKGNQDHVDRPPAIV